MFTLLHHQYPAIAHILTHSVNLPFGPKSGFKNKCRARAGLGPQKIKIKALYFCTYPAWTLLMRSGCPQGRNEVRWRPEQEASWALPCSKLRSFKSKIRPTVLKKVLVTLLGFLAPPAVIGRPHTDSVPVELCPPCPPRYASGCPGEAAVYSFLSVQTNKAHVFKCLLLPKRLSESVARRRFYAHLTNQAFGSALSPSGPTTLVKFIDLRL